MDSTDFMIEKIVQIQNENIKLQKALDVAMEAIEFHISKSDSFPDTGFITKGGVCKEAKQKIKQILKGENDE